MFGINPKSRRKTSRSSYSLLWGRYILLIAIWPIEIEKGEVKKQDASEKMKPFPTRKSPILSKPTLQCSSSSVTSCGTEKPVCGICRLETFSMQQSDRFLRRCSQCKHSEATGFYTLNNKTGHGRKRKKGKNRFHHQEEGERKDFSPLRQLSTRPAFGGAIRRLEDRGGHEDRTLLLLPLLWKVGALIMMSAFPPPPPSLHDAR